jgi:hypothetical protein
MDAPTEDEPVCATKTTVNVPIPPPTTGFARGTSQIDLALDGTPHQTPGKSRPCDGTALSTTTRVTERAPSRSK